MKKIIIYVCVVIMSLIITGCESDKSHLKDESVDKSPENMLIENKFASVDELAEFMIENKNGDFNSDAV